MPYSQGFGISRNSPLNKSYRQKLKDGDIEPSESDKKWGYTGPDGKVTGTEYTDPNSEYNTVGAGKGRGTWDPKGGSDGKGGYTKSAFSDEELETASKISENKTSQAMLEGGESWENSERNNQPKKGYDRQGNAMQLHEGDKVTLDGKDVTESHNRKLRGELSAEDQMDNAQAALGIGGFHPVFGWAADSANALISGGRGVASMFGVGEKSADHHLGKFTENLTYAAPVYGDIKALDKVNKYARRLNQFTRSSGKTYQASKSGKYMTEMFKPNSKIRNLARGATSWALQKNKDTQLGNKIKQMFGAGNIGKTIAGVTSSKGLVKGPEAFNTLTSVRDNVSSAIQPFATQAASNITPFMPTPTIASKESSPPAQSIIEKNNQEHGI